MQKPKSIPKRRSPSKRSSSRSNQTNSVRNLYGSRRPRKRARTMQSNRPNTETRRADVANEIQKPSRNQARTKLVQLPRKRETTRQELTNRLANANKTNEVLAKQNQEFAKQFNQVNKQIAALEEEKSRATFEKEEADKRAQELEEQLDAANEKANTLQERNSELESQCQQLGESDWKCPICRETRTAISTKGNHLVTHVCGHVFCNECFAQATRQHKVCPTCRRGVGKRNALRSIYL